MMMMAEAVLMAVLNMGRSTNVPGIFGIKRLTFSRDDNDERVVDDIGGGGGGGYDERSLHTSPLGIWQQKLDPS